MTRSLQFNKKKMADNLLGIIKSAMAADTAGTDSGKMKLKIKMMGEKRKKLIDLYISGHITREEFTAARTKCENELTELQSVIENIREQKEEMEKQQELVTEITEVMDDLINGVEYEDDLYKEILDKMVVNDKDHIDVYLNLYPLKLSYTAVTASKKR